MALISAPRNSLSSGEDKDYCNSRRNSSTYNIHKGDWRKPGLLPFTSGSWRMSRSSTKETKSRKGRPHLQRQRDPESNDMMLFGAGLFRFKGWPRRVSGTWGWRWILDAAAYGAGLPLFSLGVAVDRFKEGNDVGRSHLMLLLLFSLFFWVGMLPLKGRKGEIAGSHGETQISIILVLRLTKQINLRGEEKPFR